MCEVEYMLLICASEMGSAEITSLLEKCSPILSHLNNTWYTIIYIYTYAMEVRIGIIIPSGV
jgi:hypothetical protein